ncbi:MAG: hypothetical protein LBQ88_09530 [Treponema sp.]|nr:hypothetical protein [Treponema sp.]
MSKKELAKLTLIQGAQGAIEGIYIHRQRDGEAAARGRFFIDRYFSVHSY